MPLQQQWRQALGEVWQGEEARVFTGELGQPLEPTVIDQHFGRLVERLGLPRIRLHDLRHSSASLLIADGAHPKVVQRLLRHARSGVTLDLYAHLFPGTGRTEAERVAAALWQGVEPPAEGSEPAALQYRGPSRGPNVPHRHKQRARGGVSGSMPLALCQIGRAGRI